MYYNSNITGNSSSFLSMSNLPLCCNTVKTEFFKSVFFKFIHQELKLVAKICIFSCGKVNLKYLSSLNNFKDIAVNAVHAY